MINLLIIIVGYSLFRKDRVRKKGGGVAVYVRNDIDSSIISLCNNHNIFVEIVWVKCCVNNCVYYIAACYHPPKARYTDEDLRTALASDLVALSNLPLPYPPIFIIAGDFSSLNTDFLEVDFGLSQLVTKPTHGNNIIDTFFTNRPDLFFCDVFSSLIKTKHLVVHVTTNNEAVSKCSARK